MFKKQYTLPNNLGSLEVGSNYFGTKYSFTLDNQFLAEFTDKEAAAGKEVHLPDGSVLKAKRVWMFLSYELHIFVNDQPLAGSTSDPREHVKQARGIALCIGALTLTLGVLAELVPITALLEIGVGYIAAVEGAVFILLSYFISKEKAWAALAGAILLVVDLILTIIVFAESSSDTAVIIGPVFVKIFFTVYLFRGYRAIKKLQKTN